MEEDRSRAWAQARSSFAEMARLFRLYSKAEENCGLLQNGRGAEWTVDYGLWIAEDRREERS